MQAPRSVNKLFFIDILYIDILVTFCIKMKPYT